MYQPTSAYCRDGRSAGIRLPDHDRRGILALAGPRVRSGSLPAKVSILDVAPTALALLGLPAYDDVQGRVLTGSLTGSVPRAVAESTDGANPPEIDLFVYEGGSRSEAELAELEERLKELGYTQ